MTNKNIIMSYLRAIEIFKRKSVGQIEFFFIILGISRKDDIDSFMH